MCMWNLTSFSDFLCTYDIQRQRTVTVFIICTVYIEYLPLFPAINVCCCIYWELAVAGGFVELILHFIVWISIPVVVGLMNPCILDLQHNYGLLLLFSLEEGFGGLIKGWIRICNVLMYLLFSLKLCIKYIYFFFVFVFVFSCFYCII